MQKVYIFGKDMIYIQISDQMNFFKIMSYLGVIDTEYGRPIHKYVNSTITLNANLY